MVSHGKNGKINMEVYSSGTIAYKRDVKNYREGEFKQIRDQIYFGEYMYVHHTNTLSKALWSK